LGPDLHKEKEPTLHDMYLGRRVDGYEFLERIGEGGMGVVYRVRRAGVAGDLAIKVIKRGMDTHTILRRFHNERRILETLRHDNIATMLDAGTTPEGLPYFVMEFIPGQPIGEYCDARSLSIDDRLRLFQKVCAAVQCAHEAHVVHRDIKPENILVTAAGEPKLLDFGIAKVLDFTSPSHDVTITLSPVMTPHYASPEQARGAAVTAASDTYSLGVLLYELLAGVSPYRTPGAGAPSLVHAICHERPQPPSSAVALLSPADSKAVAVAAARSTDPVALRRMLSGDLDAIVLTALEKQPARRYRAVDALSADIGRHLDGRRVEALTLTRRYARLGPGIRLFAAAILVLIICAVLFAILYQPARARLTVRPSVAVLGFENLSHDPSAEWLSTALTEMLSTELAAGGRLRTVPGELVARVKLELALPNAQTFAAPTLTRLRNSLSADYVVLGSYLALGEGAARQVRLDLRLQDTRDGEVVASASETRKAVELAGLVTNAGALLRGQLGAGVATAEAAARGSLPESADAARLYAEGLERLRAFDTLAARDLLRNAVAAAPGHALSHAALAGANSLLGYDVEARDEARKALDLSAGLAEEERLSIEGRYLETSHDWKRAVEIYRTLREAYPDNLEYGLRLAAAQTQAGEPRRALATVAELRALPSAGRDPRVDLAEAEAAFAASDLIAARAAARRAAQSGSDQGLGILTAGAHVLESRIALTSGDPRAALAAATQAQQLYLSANHRQGVALALNESAGVLTQRGDVAGARARYEQALTVCRAIGDQTCIGADLDSLGVLRRRQGDLKGALEMHRGALDVRRAVGDRAGVATSLYNIGNVLEIIGDLPRARQAADESLQIRRQLGERRTAALTLSRLANIRRREGALDEALKMNEEALAALRSIGDRGGVAMALINLGLTLFDRGELARAQSVFDEALEIRRQQRDRNNIAQLDAAISRISLAQDRLREAASLIAESDKLRQELGENVGIALNDLIRSEILLEQNDPAGAERAARDAAAIFRRAGAWGREAEAIVAIARAQSARSDAARAQSSIDSAGALLRDSKDARLLLRRDVILARVRHAQGRADEAAAILDRALAKARGLGMAGVAFEVRQTMAETGRPAASLSSEARSAGFLLIARKSR
jgi:tetratricopeptide (TPR) repeat protein/tRNA A-37 threonylcarbamoyl transferase component Bud32